MPISFWVIVHLQTDIDTPPACRLMATIRQSTKTHKGTRPVPYFYNAALYRKSKPLPHPTHANETIKFIVEVEHVGQRTTMSPGANTFMESTARELLRIDHEALDMKNVTNGSWGLRKSPTEFEWLVVCVVEIPDAPGSWGTSERPKQVECTSVLS
jgi:hypothetical protein